MTVTSGTVLNYTLNTDNGFASALRFGALSSDLVPPSLFNYGTMNYQWNGNTGATWFITYSPEVFWDQAVVENYGTISMIAANAPLAKVFTSENRLPHIINHGTITVQAKGSAIIAEGWSPTQHITNEAGAIMQATSLENAFGLYLNNGGTVENAGQIIAQVTGGAGVSNGAYGVSMREGVGNIYNSGLIEASDADTTTKYATAIIFHGQQVTIVNDGTLRGDYAIIAVGAEAYVENNGLLDGEVGFGDGHDVFENNGNVTRQVDLADGNDEYDGRLGTVSGTVLAGEGYDRLKGGAGAEVLLGEGGADWLWGGGGADDLDGGAGEDIFVYAAATDSSSDARDRIRAFQTGVDQIELRYLSASAINWSQESDGSGTFNLVTVTTAGGPLTIRVDGAIAMSDFVIVEDRSLTGGAGADTLIGGAGNDILDGLGGADQMEGRAGDDVYHVDDAGDVIVEVAPKYYETGLDMVLTSVSYTLTAGAEIEVFSANEQDALAALALTGNAFAQTITANAGANRLAGGGGADILIGLGGDDTYYVDSADTIIREAIGGGNDTLIVRATMSYTLAAGAEIELLTLASDPGLGLISISGNEFDQTLLGNAFANGLGGGGGNDRLIGGGGADFLGGGEDGDVYVYLSVSDSVAGAEDIVSLAFNEDLVDLVVVQPSAVSWAPSTRPILDGGAGLPIYGYIVTITTPGGTMSLKSIDLPFRTDFLLGGEILGTASADTLTGGTASDVIIGREGNDLIHGRDGNDFLAGHAGNDVLDGGRGADQLVGGLGDDVYHVDDPGDLAWERGGMGTDTLFASVDYVLPADSVIEILRTSNESALTAISLTGNLFANLIIGNAGANILDGGADPNPADLSYRAPDTLRGLGGNDIYYVDTADTVVELAGQGNDSVYARSTYALAAGVSVEMLAMADAASTSNYDLTGNEFSQRVVGNAGNNVLRGAGGSDVLVGGAGGDRLIGGDGHDWLEGGTGTDVFVFEATADSRLTALRSDGGKIMPDVIADFLRGTDRIDLSAIDAVAGTAANEAFSFIGAGAFTHQAGQLRAVTANGATSVYADVNGDGAADLHIMLLATPVALTAADFIL